MSFAGNFSSAIFAVSNLACAAVLALAISSG